MFWFVLAKQIALRRPYHFRYGDNSHESNESLLNSVDVSKWVVRWIDITRTCFNLVYPLDIDYYFPRFIVFDTQAIKIPHMKQTSFDLSRSCVSNPSVAILRRHQQYKAELCKDNSQVRRISFSCRICAKRLRLPPSVPNNIQRPNKRLFGNHAPPFSGICTKWWLTSHSDVLSSRRVIRTFPF